MKIVTHNFKTMVMNNDPFAAALAAAAELAKSGAFICSPDTKKGMLFPLTIPPSPSIEIVTPSDEEDKDIEEDSDRRTARNRERNREHARRTRLRKKAQLEALQSKVKGLQAESKVLKQSLEECSIATILVGLSSGDNDAIIQSMITGATEVEEQDVLRLVNGKRKRFVSDASEKIPQPLKVNIDGQTTLIGGGRTHINWKTGVYSDEDGNHRQLTQNHLKSLR
jgi:hypothetical protein